MIEVKIIQIVALCVSCFALGMSVCTLIYQLTK